MKAKKARHEFEQDDLLLVMRSLEKSKDAKAQKLHSILAGKFLVMQRTGKKMKLKKITRNVAMSLTEDELMAKIKNGINWLTGTPVADIRPESKLKRLGMTPMKVEVFRKYLNKIIADEGGNSWIGPSDISGDSTVQEVYVLTYSKIP